ncbi:hypothetical protein [Bradyrhizobium sp. S3.2.12]|uniref:hypothetical protein n=1 Tax=Bradyrhizobium sp. S3.2.12 TaxID=3156387 RepID=UPI003391E98B
MKANWLSPGLAMALALCTHPVLSDEVRSSSKIGILVATGSDQDAINYYKRIGPLLGLKNAKTDLPDLTALLRHFGFTTLTGEKLEASASTTLMKAFPNDQVLSTKFFAPKIVDFNFPSTNPKYPYLAGWRKLVRLEALPSSKAAQAGLGAAYVLFNYVQKDPAVDPFPDASFKTESFNTQVIIPRENFKKGSEDAAFFLDFDTRSKGYAANDFLFAAFDTAPNPGNTHQNYYVPIACAQCHGHDQEAGAPESKSGTYPFITINYLDTDQWYDMAGFGDFPSSPNAKFDVLYDGGSNHASSQYKAAFDVIRKLNKFIQQQNADSARADGSSLFRIKAVDKWLAIHQSNDNPVAPIDRALDLGNGSAVWKNTKDDVHLLEVLDHYCFRCHSSVLYDVFDKQAVLDERAAIIVRVQRPPTNVQHMPQGRVLDSSTVADLVTYLKDLK